MMKIYALGSNGSGQLGIGHKEDVSVPKETMFDVFETLSPTDIPLIRAGGNHTLLLTEEQLFCSGDPASGACGLSPEPLQSHPHFRKVILEKETLHHSPSRIVCCASTWEASFIVKDNDHGQATQMYSFGTGNKGELGLGELIFRSPKPQLLKDFPPPDTEVVDLAASLDHVVAVLSNGELYGWGNGRKGQLGQPQTFVHAPRRISSVNFKAVRAVCGRGFTYAVSTLDDGKHAVLGTDKWGIITSAPSNVHDWKDIGAGWGSLFVLLQNGELLSWGRDDHGQLAPPQLPWLSHIAVGSEHALGVSIDGDVLAWGWGEHGNCGPSTTEGDVRGKWNVIASSKYLAANSKIIAVGAGCATSWICIAS